MPSASLARTEQVTAAAIQMKHLEEEVGVSGQEEPPSGPRKVGEAGEGVQGGQRGTFSQ